MLPVIMITAYATVDTAIEAMKLGAIDYIKKPFDFQELEKGILAAIEDIKFRNVKDIYSENCYERFNKLTKTNKGLCISRTFESINNKENVKMISIEENLKPKPIENLRKEIENILSKEINTVMLTNIEYLIKFNKSDKVQLFLRWLNKQTLLNNGKLILSANLHTTGDKEQKMLRDMITDIHLGLFSDSISNYLRRKIIIKLADGQKHTFTKIANDLKIEDNPKLSFHLKKLKEDGMIEQDSEKKYFLSALGTEIAELIEKIKKEKLKTKDDILWMPFT
jgi:YesN/AraC family two-component response regulator